MATTLPGDMRSALQAVPDSLAELQKSSHNVGQIAEYCRQLGQSGANPEEVLRQTRDYVKASLVNVAYHVHAVSLQLTNFLSLQASELEKLDVTVSLLSEVRCSVS